MKSKLNIFFDGKKKTNQPLTPWEEAQRKREKNFSKKSSKKKRIGTKLPKLVAQRKSKLKKKLIINFVVFGIITLASLYFILPISKVKEVKVIGVDKVTQKAIRQASNIGKDDYLFQIGLEKKKLSMRIEKKVSEVKQTNVSIVGRLVILKVVKAKIIGYLERDNNYFALNNKGSASIVQQSTPKGNVPILTNFKSSSEIKLLAVQMNGLTPSLLDGISEIDATPVNVNPERIKVYMNDGNEIIATLSTFAKKMQYYPQIKAKSTGKIKIDFEVGAYSTNLK